MAQPESSRAIALQRVLSALQSAHRTPLVDVLNLGSFFRYMAAAVDAGEEEHTRRGNRSHDGRIVECSAHHFNVRIPAFVHRRFQGADYQRRTGRRIGNLPFLNRNREATRGT